MTKAELINLLKDYNDDTEVLVDTDDGDFADIARVYEEEIEDKEREDEYKKVVIIEAGDFID